MIGGIIMKVINGIGDTLLAIYCLIRIFSGDALFYEYFTFGGLLIFAVCDIVRLVKEIA